MQKEEYLIKNACYSVTKYYLCKQNNKRSLLGRKQRSQVARSFLNRYLFSLCNKVTLLFSNSCILEIILCSNVTEIIKQADKSKNTKSLFPFSEGFFLLQSFTIGSRHKNGLPLMLYTYF